jgi:hypothetical protein
MVTWNHNNGDFDYHWVTITHYVKYIDDTRYVTTSNWAEQEVYNLDTWFNDSSLYKGIICFE